MMKVHTSLGSQPQKRPQASRAQIAPKIRVKVQHTNATEWMRKLSASREDEEGSRSSTCPKRPQCSGNSSVAARSARTRSCFAWSSCIEATTAPRIDSAVAMIATPMWM